MLKQAIVQYFGQQAQLNCDAQCHKAWGTNSRPKIQLSNNEDDYAFLADHELGEAPQNPGTEEGGHIKPRTPDEFPNKWCARECERCSMSNPGEWHLPLPVKDFSRRQYNMNARREAADRALARAPGQRRIEMKPDEYLFLGGSRDGEWIAIPPGEHTIEVPAQCGRERRTDAEVYTKRPLVGDDQLFHVFVANNMNGTMIMQRLLDGYKSSPETTLDALRKLMNACCGSHLTQTEQFKAAREVLASQRSSPRDSR